MEISFANYRFLSKSLMLYRDGEFIELKRNQAVLLQFFLSAPEAIHSKDAIMDSVWQGKVVSEQVVFQTISQLRGILGDHVIKTFSKKGYKWQLPITVISDIEGLVLDDCLTKKSAQHNASNFPLNSPSSIKFAESSVNNKIIWKQSYLAVLVALFTLIILFIITVKFTQDRDLEKQRSIMLPISGETEHSLTTNFNRKVRDALSGDSRFNVKKLHLSGSIEQFFSAPKFQWQQAKLIPQDWLLWGEVLSSDKGFFFRYAITNKDLTWRGYVF